MEVNFQRDLLHDQSRRWPQSNCYVDLWIELLSNNGYNPIEALGFTSLIEYQGDQFTFFKFPTADLHFLYDIKINELSLYSNLEAQLVTQVNRFKVVLLEVDSYYLPDTKGLSYRDSHSKTTIGIDQINVDEQKLGYFHNDTYGILEGDDYVALISQYSENNKLFPYAEMVDIKRNEKRDHSFNRRKAKYLFIDCSSKMEEIIKNPFEEFEASFETHILNLSSEKFHEFAFNHFRMAGSNFELLGSHAEWLLGSNSSALIQACFDIADELKLMQFKSSRMVSRKKFDPCTESFTKLKNSYNILKELITDSGTLASLAEHTL